jgi:hypothetical protein
VIFRGFFKKLLDITASCRQYTASNECGSEGTSVSGASLKGGSMALEKELAVYNQKLPELKENNEGKFVLIHGDSVDVFTSYEDAIKAGYEKYRLEPFLVKQIVSMEQVQFISRFVDPHTMARAS